MDEEKRKSVERGHKQLLEGLGDFVPDEDTFCEETLLALEEFERAGNCITDEGIQ